MSDVLEDLEDGLLSIANGSAVICEVHEDVLTRAIQEIRHLRSTVTILRRLAGAVSVDTTDQSFRNIKLSCEVNPKTKEFLDGKSS